MKVRVVAFGLVLAMAGGIYLLFNEIPTELAPVEDRGEIRINMSGPEGATFGYMDRVIDAMVKDFRETLPEEELDGMISVTSPGFGTASTNSGFVRLILSDAENRNRSQQEIFSLVNQKLKDLYFCESICLASPIHW